MLLTFAGPAALSEFRRLALLARCQQALPRLADVRVSYFYMVQLRRPLEEEERQRLERLLEVCGAALSPDDHQLLIAPRPGTISPWSSKATDILHNTGLGAVCRAERGRSYRFVAEKPLSREELQSVLPLLHDRMTEAPIRDLAALFRQVEPRSLKRLPVLKEGRRALEQANAGMGLALSGEEMDYFLKVFQDLGRDPTDVELMMFAVVNSEHCRHKIFNAAWIVDGKPQERSLFDMIRHTHALHPEGCVKAYSDNAAVLQGFALQVFRPLESKGYHYAYQDKQTHVLIKVETHNHPTAISPFPGASTGVGGEIRDEGSAGKGGQSQAGLCAFFTSNLRLPGFVQPWEKEYAPFPARLATPLEIMIEGPIGGAAFGNEFGRPNICGVFRTYEERVNGRYRGYHKPIMVAGGIGLIDQEHVEKKVPSRGDYVIQLGGPAMLIGLGGGAASSMDTGSNLEDLDFASVQRDNPEMQRRCQELLNRCIALGEDNPILAIHDVGAGGLSNACPELVEKTGARFELRAIRNDDPGMSPMQLWCNEAQERYVLVIGQESLECFARLAARERCLFAVIGQISGDGRLHLHDALFGNAPIDQLELKAILGKPPRLRREVAHLEEKGAPLDLAGASLKDAVERVLRLPAVAAKTFLITIADRTVTGLIARDQLVGPYQVPVADVALTCHSHTGYTGTAMAMGERAPLALIDAPASGRMAIAEALTNIAAARIGPIHRVKLSGNWMCACGEEGEDALLYDTVQAVGMEFCPTLGIAIPVGKDSLSMRAVWKDGQGKDHKIVAPLSLVVSAFAPVEDVRWVVTPDLKRKSSSRLLLIDLGKGQNRLGGSALAQVYNQLGDTCPDVEADALRRLYEAVQEMHERGLMLAYHDRADGGLLASAAEMAFAGRSGVELDITALGSDPLAALFAEEVGVLIQCRASDEEAIRTLLEKYRVSSCSHFIGAPTDEMQLTVRHKGQELYAASVLELHATWAELSYRMQAHRDHPECAREEWEAIADAADPGLNFQLTCEPAPAPLNLTRPRVAILREQGVNGQVEMAAAFDAAGGQSADVTMTDLLEGRAHLRDFQGLAACGGFSYGDVLGAGAGWARTILFHEKLREMFAEFFARPDTFTLGVCNGCQMLSHLQELIPGAQGWPRFLRNRSEQFEARLATVEVLQSPSVLLRGMEGARLPIAVAHGEGRAHFASGDLEKVRSRVCLRFVDNYGHPTERHPFNPNGSPQGIAALTSQDGRATIVMPHPERVFRMVQLSWRPAEWSGEQSPWLRLFQNACEFARQA